MKTLPQLVPLSKQQVVFVPTLTPYEAGALDARENIPALQFRLYLCTEDEIAYMMGFDDALAAPSADAEHDDAIEDDYDFIRTGC
jgi:hypothetical protein